jgi:hypothetical protein
MGQSSNSVAISREYAMSQMASRRDLPVPMKSRNRSPELFRPQLAVILDFMITVNCNQEAE